MVIYDQLLINGSIFSNKSTLQVAPNMSENNSSSTFNISYDNIFGSAKNVSTVGNEVIVYAQKDVNPPTRKIFGGFVDNIEFMGYPNTGRINITGRDYYAILQDATVPPVIYQGIDGGSLVKDLIDRNTSGLNSGSINVSTGQIISSMRINHLHVSEAIKNVGDQMGYYSYVDPDRYVHFDPIGSVSSSFTIGSHNATVTTNFTTTDNDMANEVYVYGDRVLTAAPTVTQVSDGVGSVIQLAFKPSNVEVMQSGTTIVNGGILSENSVPFSGTFYLIDYENAKIIWTSGTTVGYNVPLNTVISTVRYDRTLPIVKYIRDDSSIQSYGKKSRVIIDRSIKDPVQATDLAVTTLYANNVPKVEGRVNIADVDYATIGANVLVNLPNENVGSQTYQIIGATYNFTPITRLNNQVLSLKLNKKVVDVTDTIKQILIDLRKIQAGEIDNTDVLTTIDIGGGSAMMINKRWTGTLNGIGNAFVMDHSINGLLDGTTVMDGATTPILTFAGNYNNAYIEDFSTVTLSGPGTATWNTASGLLSMTNLSTHFPTSSFQKIGSIYLDPSVTISQVGITGSETRWNPTDSIRYFVSTDRWNTSQEVPINTSIAVNPGSDLQTQVVFTGNGNKDTYVQNLTTSYT